MRYDVVGDVHACLFELYQLLEKLGYTWEKKGSIYRPPDGRQLISVGDIVSRGRSSVVTYGFVCNMISAGYMKVVRGNHCDKIMRWAMGKNVTLMHGDDRTAKEFEDKGIPKESIVKNISSWPYFLELDEGKLIVAHASYKRITGVEDNFNKLYRVWSLFGPTTGLTKPNGLPDRIDWAAQREIKEDSPIIVCGHQPFKEVRVINKVYQIDTGCVFGNKLTCLKYPEMEIVQVPAFQKYAENVGWEE